jgi:DNA mismatch repair protein MutS
MIYDDYIEYCNQYTEKYGPNTVVFMQVGDFFELYAVQNETEKAGADIFRVCELCNIQVSRKNKSILENSRQNPLMAGFPIATISKFIQIMIQNNYTCVLIRQVTPPPNPKREVTEIISPSMTLTVGNNEGSYLMVMYWDSYLDTSSQQKILTLGMASVDITTGKTWVYEAHGTKEDPEFAKDEAFRFLNSYQPKELVFLGNIDTYLMEEMEGLFGSLKNLTLHKLWNSEIVKPFSQIAYQHVILEKVFGKTGIITPIESLNLERVPFATTAFCYMIQFAYEHNETMIQELEAPIQWKNQTHLILEANSMYQLNLVSANPGDTPLLSLLNRTSTAFGSRMFKERLLHPILSKEELENRYREIELFLEGSFYKEVSLQLQSILDVERMVRKIGLIKFQPCEWVNLVTSFEQAKKVLELLMTKRSDISNSLQTLEMIMKDYQDTLDLEECSKYNMVDMFTSMFKQTIYPDLDEVSLQCKNRFRFLDDLRAAISNIGSGETTLCRLDCNERDGYHLTITKKRWEQVQQLCPTKLQVGDMTILWKDCKVKPLSSSSSILRLSHSMIDKTSDEILMYQRKISILNTEYYKQYLEVFYHRYQKEIQEVVFLLGGIDICCTNAKNAVEYHYTKPKIVANNSSFFRVKQVRHPIIERLSIRTEYVANDLSLGEEKKGLLLYGINASGKSSMMKAIGLNIIMAQAGMFVAAEELELSPYEHLFTRISGMDNIYRGLSTFTVEMLELKNILNRCNEKSLILGDELCAGTEAISAISIVAAGIQELCEKESSFIFATHLHELLDVTSIKNATKLQVSHMHIEFDPSTGKIMYDRTLKDGNGSSIYGLEVCRFLKMTDRFLERANQIRKQIMKVPLYIIEPKTSVYNSEVFVSECTLCGKPASETHHIKHQKDADLNGYIGNTHKDHRSNLLVLCEECHKKQHHGEVSIEKMVMTSIGVEPKFQKRKTEQMSEPTANQKDYLLYQIQGWYYRLKPTHTWKKLIPSNYENVCSKLNQIIPHIPQKKEEISMYLAEHQSEFLVLSM